MPKKRQEVDSDAIDESDVEESSDHGSEFEQDQDTAVSLESEESIAEEESELDVKPPAKRKGATPKSAAPRKKSKQVKRPSMGRAETESESESDVGTKEPAKPQKIREKKPPPKEDVSAGQIGPRTLEFLERLTHEKYQNRDWFQQNDAWYRQSWAQWNAFVDEVQTEMQKADDTLPILPARDLTHRIYRDVRFSSDKRPYKTNMCMTTSRAGRKGPFAGYFVQIAANGKSMVAGGKWSMDKNDLATIRHHIQSHPERLRRVIEAAPFVEMFGPAKPNRPASPKKPRNKKDQDEDEGPSKPAIPAIGLRQNIFGHDDELVNAPKGIPKDHPDIDLLRCRTIAVIRYFTDEQVLSPDFKVTVRKTVEVMKPLVTVLNEMLVPGDGDSDDDD